MRILWITNTVFPEPSRAVRLRPPVIGGWMYGLAERIAGMDDISLAVATVYAGSELKVLDLSGIRYYLIPPFPAKRYLREWEGSWRRVVADFSPDLVHIHGTERPHGLACMKACPSQPYIVSIQGLTGVIERYHYGGIDRWSLIRNTTFRDLVKGDSVFAAGAQRAHSGIYEREAIRRASLLVGRTEWDRIHTQSIAPKVPYAHCGESLRDGFYGARKWSAGDCARYSVFMSQGHAPIKGLHNVIRAIAALRQDYPGIRLRVAGSDITCARTVTDRLKRSGYGKYLARLAATLGVSDAVTFTGRLDERQMISEFQSANAYVCASSIENSPNSVGEAQLVGTPVVATSVGGIPDMVVHGETGLLYRFEEHEVLADRLRTLFEDRDLAAGLSMKARRVAEARHDRDVNTGRLRDIYENVVRRPA